MYVMSGFNESVSFEAYYGNRCNHQMVVITKIYGSIIFSHAISGFKYYIYSSIYVKYARCVIP